MNKTCSQPRVMCQSKHYFIIEKYVLTKTPPVCFQEVCSHYELKQYETAHSLYHFNLFLFEFNLSNLLCLGAFLPLER
jgi:hypothetical protein